MLSKQLTHLHFYPYYLHVMEQETETQRGAGTCQSPTAPQWWALGHMGLFIPNHGHGHTQRPGERDEA